MTPILETIGDRVVIASISGGKDSTAMCLYLRESGIPFRAVHILTGWESIKTDRYVREVLSPLFGGIEFIRATVDLPPALEAQARWFEARMGVEYSPMVRTCLKKGMLPSRTGRWCTQELKAHVIRDYLKALEDEPVNAVGIRGQESGKRAKMPVWEYSKTYDCDVWRPIHAWTEQDVIDIHTRHGVPPNPLYLRGARRVGCWPCVNSRFSEIVHLADEDPGRIALLADLEAAILPIAEARWAEKGTSMAEQGYTAPAWFVNPAPARRKVTTSVPTGEVDLFGNPAMRTETKIVRDGDLWPIKRVVSYARSVANSDAPELFAGSSRDAGCMRWGLCDTPSPKVTR